MNLFEIKQLIIRKLPKPFSSFIIWCWRKPFSFVRNYLGRRSANKNVAPYFKKVSFKDTFLYMYIDTTESWVSKEVHFHGMHEEHILEKIIEHLPVGGTFVDVGANVGQHSLYAAQKVGDTGRVYAFEPLETSAEHIRLSANKNSFAWLEVIQKAATDFIGQTTFYKYGLTDISSRNKNFLDRPAEEITVFATTLDTELDSVQRIDLIKIDVEGYEMDVLRGGSQIIEKYKPKIILEFSPVFYKNLNPDDSVSILEFLFKHGYTITDIDNLKEDVTDIAEYCHKLEQKGNISNILCIYEKQ